MRRIYLLLICLIAVQFLSADMSEYQVQDLQVSDIPNDDGSGLMLSWNPLPKEKRIIEYRIYRGISPDSLFLLGSIEVNAKTGVSGDKMYFYDRGFLDFVSIYSPASMKPDTQLESPYYRPIPRDINVYGPMLEHFYILGVIINDEFYYRAQKIETDDGVSAGLNLYQFDGLYATVLPGETYYYAIGVVDKAGRHYQPCPVASGSPEDNYPEKLHRFDPVYVSDLNRLQFEWDLPVFKDDIHYHSIYMLEESQLEQFDKFTEAIGDTTQTVENPAQLVFRRQTAFPYESMDIAEVEVKDGRIVDEKHDIDVQYDPQKKYFFAISLVDYYDRETFSDPKPLDVITSEDLPKLPPFEIRDMPNDKGEYNELLYAKPLVMISGASYKGDNQVVLNYEINLNDDYRINNIFFDVYDHEGNPLGHINEFYQDNIVYVDVPDHETVEKGLTVRMSLKTGKTPVPEDYILSQDVFYSSDIKDFQISPLKIGNEVVQNFQYKLYKRSPSEAVYRTAKKLSPYQRFHDDNIPYETSIFKLVNQFDAAKGLLLVSPSVTVYFDREKEMPVETSIFGDEVANSIEEWTKEADAYADSAATAATDEEKAYYEEAEKYYRGMISTQQDDPYISKANQIKSNRKRMKYLSDERHRMKRSFEYQFCKSDGRGRFTLSEPYAHDGETFFFPKSEWFDTSKIPMLISTLLFGFFVWLFIMLARRGRDFYIRPIAGLSEIDNAIGRATEMGRPMLFVPGLSSIDDVATLAGLSILGHVSRKAAEYDSRILVPVCDYIVLPVAQEIVKEAYFEAGRPDAYNRGDVFFIAERQFAYVAGVNGIMLRERTATNFFMGMFFAEALIMTETGNAAGCVQIAGTDAVTQIPFFITTCDYTLIGEELYAASAYLSKEPLTLGTLKAQDAAKFLIILFTIVGTILSTFHLTFLINAFPSQ